MLYLKHQFPFSDFRLIVLISAFTASVAASLKVYADLVKDPDQTTSPVLHEIIRAVTPTEDVTSSHEKI
jgi:hypothetical protein